MEKVIYLLWRDAQVSPDTFNHRLRSEVAGQLLALGACGVQLNLSDADVQPAAGLRQENNRPLPDASLSLWLDSANGAKFQRNLATMMDSCSRFIDFDKIDVLPTSQYCL